MSNTNRATIYYTTCWDLTYWATNDLDMTGDELSKSCLDYRGLKQCCEVERSQVRSADGQMSHIALSIRAFVRLCA